MELEITWRTYFLETLSKCNWSWVFFIIIFIFCWYLSADELVKEFNSSDVSRQEKALAKADQFISSLEQVEPCKTKINKTVINKNPSFENGPLVQYLQSIKNVIQYNVNKNTLLHFKYIVFMIINNISKRLSDYYVLYIICYTVTLLFSPSFQNIQYESSQNPGRFV